MHHRPAPPEGWNCTSPASLSLPPSRGSEGTPYHAPSCCGRAPTLQDSEPGFAALMACLGVALPPLVFMEARQYRVRTTMALPPYDGRRAMDLEACAFGPPRSSWARAIACLRVVATRCCKPPHHGRTLPQPSAIAVLHCGCMLLQPRAVPTQLAVKEREE